MAYIEAFFYYLLVVISVFVFFYLVLFFLLLVVKGIKERDQLNVFEIGNFFGSVIKHKLLKIFTLFYLTAFSVFYFIQLSTYLGSERAYPKAKMYKIVADVSMFYFDFFIANRDLYFKPSGLKYIQAYEQWQNHLMQKAFVYIPKDDAERAIWRYEYYYANYVRAMTAPIDFESLDKHDLKMLLKIGGYTTLYKPIAKEMIQEVGSLLDSLMEKPMQDKYYDEVNRYATLVMLGTWWEKKRLLYYSLGAKNPKAMTSNEHLIIMEQLHNDPSYAFRVNKLVDFLDIAKEHSVQSKQLQNFLKKHKYIYADFMALRVRFKAYLVYQYFSHQKFSCEAEILQKYLQSKKEFLIDVAKTNQYKKMDWREKHLTESFFHNYLEDYLLNHYCSISEDYLTIGSSLLGNFEESLKTKQIIQRIENER